MDDGRLYVVNLLWVNDPGGFDEYQERAKPILARHGVHIERWLMTEAIVGNGIDKPDQIVVTWFKDAAAMEAFVNDPEYREVAEIRDQAVKRVAITAHSVFGD